MFRIQQWMIDWLQTQPESGGRLIEAALVAHYGLEPPGESQP
jgi:hypothetical protein